jgi:RHS repeat-associated protein
MSTCTAAGFCFRDKRGRAFDNSSGTPEKPRCLLTRRWLFDATQDDDGVTTIDYTWNDFGNLLQITNGTSTDIHEYDTDSRRMRSKWNNSGTWVNFVYDELETSYPAIIAEYTLVSTTYTVTSVNTHALGLVSTNRSGTKRYFHFDGLGSTMALTDGSEVVQDTYTYSAFGVQESSTGSSVNPYRWVGMLGYRDEPAAGSAFARTLLGVRYYSAYAGRMFSEDPLGLKKPYLYSFNEPQLYVDPTGLIPVIGVALKALEAWQGSRESGTKKLCYTICDTVVCGGLSGLAKAVCKKLCHAACDASLDIGAPDVKSIIAACLASSGPDACSACCDRLCRLWGTGQAQNICLNRCTKACLDKENGIGW